MATMWIMRMVLKVIGGIADIAIHRVVLGGDSGLCVSVHVDLAVWLGLLMTSELNVRDIYISQSCGRHTRGNEEDFERMLSRQCCRRLNGNQSDSCGHHGAK